MATGGGGEEGIAVCKEGVSEGECVLLSLTW